MVMKTPGVYIVEKSAFPNSVVQVATAVPAFIGYTQKALNGNVSLHMAPKRITSMGEFITYFGGPPEPMFDIVGYKDHEGTSPLSADGVGMKDSLPRAVFTTQGPLGPVKHELVQKTPAFNLYGSMKLFFENGGGPCYIVSIGEYMVDVEGSDTGEKEHNAIDANAMKAAIDALKKESEPTMVVIPEATRLARQDCVSVQQKMLSHCGLEMRNRFAILDVFGGHLPQGGPMGNPVAAFRSDIGINQLDFGAAYYPWVNTSVFGVRDVTYENIVPEARQKLIKLLKMSVPGDKELAAEIEKTSAPALTGDFTLSLTPGLTAPITKADINAEDDDTSDDALTYSVIGDAAKMGGKVVKTDAPDAAIDSFTQEELETGAVSFVHDGTTKAGKFAVVVTDANGIATDASEIAVEVVGGLLNLSGVQQQTPVEIDVAADNEGADPDSIVLRDATSDDGKTKDIDGVGTWQAESGKVTFTPNAEFVGAEAKVAYTMTKDDAPLPFADLRILVPDSPLAVVKTDTPSPATIDKTMRAVVPLYNDVMEAMTKRLNAMPPSSAMAGLYTMVDGTRGVWKAPANVSVGSVTSPMVNINHEEQENLNVSTTGKSINAIRPFVGEGTLVWGARTLDGNSLDWRYINVRRTMIMIEESIRLASKAYVFEPNTAQTWVTMRSMIENFLTSIWKQGGLAGAVPSDAFSVHVGLGETMTPVDILEGILRITVLLAVVRPAEFIEITFQQQMQKS
ncbi:cadherin-like domain-containing protein [Yoonia sp. BS5-3]|uniref:Cadherin-like domain-containing protein n=1 Tax=Yoonia phaeophyticola TaxID=3137369 RepID=A0ABZ2V608_9RHOB